MTFWQFQGLFHAHGVDKLQQVTFQQCGLTRESALCWKIYMIGLNLSPENTTTSTSFQAELPNYPNSITERFGKNYLANIYIYIYI